MKHAPKVTVTEMTEEEGAAFKASPKAREIAPGWWIDTSGVPAGEVDAFVARLRRALVRSASAVSPSPTR